MDGASLTRRPYASDGNAPTGGCSQRRLLLPPPYYNSHYNFIITIHITIVSFDRYNSHYNCIVTYTMGALSHRRRPRELHNDAPETCAKDWDLR